MLEPSIRTVLRTFLAKFKAPEFTRGLVSIGNCLVGHLHRDRQYRRMGDPQFPLDRPLVFTGVVATRLFKVAGA